MSQTETFTCSETSGAGVVNIAAYLFTELDQLEKLRERLREFCRTRELKGTILLAPEGINLFMAGSRPAVDELCAELRADARMAILEVKESLSDHQPFTRLLVKIKKEIIAFGIEGIAPAQRTSPKISAETLKTWLDEGKPLTLLDTRNDYEVELGTFANAVPIGVDHFRDFPQAVQQLPADWKERPIVMFCTGGIRCEKAGPYMESQGFKEIYQLDGGILKYFEKVGGEHYVGDCFVFDHRVALNPHLVETSAVQCYACQQPLTEADQQHEHYQIGKTCPYCWQEVPVSPELTEADREAIIRVIADPLPGSIPYTNERPLNVPQRYHNWSLLDFLCDYHPHIGREQWSQNCDLGLLRYRGRPLASDFIVWEGQPLFRLEPETIEPAVNPEIRIVAWEEPIIVFDKPAPLPVHPCGRFNKNSMTSLLDLAFPDLKLRPAHRLDANTTGLIVFTSARQASLAIQRQFERRTAEKTYLCRVLGHPNWDDCSCIAPISRKPEEHGARLIDRVNGWDSRTEFHVVKRYSDGTSLLEARPLTGRTNQIRVHLWQLGYPIKGDPVYRTDFEIGPNQATDLATPHLCLHAWKLKLKHPTTDLICEFETEPPAWSQTELLENS